MATEIAPRETYGRTLVELGKENKDIVVLDADLSRSTMTQYFAQSYPDRFFDCGIAEQNMVGISAGLSAAGKIPFASTFAVFAIGRCFDQLRISVAYSKLNVKIVATHGGICVGEDGASHQSVEDLSLACSLPGFKVVVPADSIETAQAVRVAASTYGPFYIRLPRPKLPVIYDDKYNFNLGKASVIREGKDATIIALGIMVSAALKAADNLKQSGIDCGVINMSTLKPIDEAAIIKAASIGPIVTAEEHLEHGGLGSVVAQVVARNKPTLMEFVAVKDSFGKSGKPEELLVRYGLAYDDIERAVRKVLKH